jgi:hypothetical protein
MDSRQPSLHSRDRRVQVLEVAKRQPNSVTGDLFLGPRSAIKTDEAGK